MCSANFSSPISYLSEAVLGCWDSREPADRLDLTHALAWETPVSHAFPTLMFEGWIDPMAEVSCHSSHKDTRYTTG